MIPPRQHWAIQAETTNACPRSCSNCTRSLPHARKRFFVSPDEFRTMLNAVRLFITDSDPHPNDPTRNYGKKLIGMMGGEPTIHPKFAELCEIMREVIPGRDHRGLWSGWRPGMEKYADVIAETFGPASNYNFHEPPSQHQPILVAIRELIPDEATMWDYIDRCWLQVTWSSSVTPKGFFFCEVAAALDEIFDGPGGLPLEPNCWKYDLSAYRDQIERWCPLCGCAAPLPGRLDNQNVDDISPGNLAILKEKQSPRVLAGDYRVFDCAGYDPSNPQNSQAPAIYRTEQRKGLQC